MRTLDDLSTTLLPPPFVVACVAARTQEDGASSSLVDDCSPWISSLWRIYPKERGGGRELESLGDTSSSNRNPTVYYPLGYDQFRPAQLFHPLVIFFFLSVLLLFSSSFRRVLRATFEFILVLPRCLVTERVGGSYPPPPSPESRFPSFEKKTRIKSVEVDEISTMSFSFFFLEFFLYIDKNRSRLEGGEVGGPSSSHWKGLGRGLILIFALCEYSRGGRGEESRSGEGE